MKMTRKVFCILFLLVIFLCSCRDVNKGLSNQQIAAETSESVGPLSVDDSNVTITVIRVAVNDFEISQYEELKQVFEEENPNIRIQLLSVNEILDLNSANDDRSFTDTSLQLAQTADVFPAHYVTGANPGRVVRDLAPFIQADSSFDTNDFYPHTLREENGRVWILPTSLNFLLIFYNKNAFVEAGLAYPQPGWTWQEFRSIANALTIRDGSEVTQWGFAQPFTSHLAFIEGQLLQSLMDTTVNPPTVRYRDEDVVTAVQWYTNLFLQDGLAPTLSPIGAFSLIQANKVAMWPDTSRSLSLYDNNRQIGTVPFPAPDSAINTTPLFVNGWVMSAGTVHSEAAWKWMVYLSRQQPPNTFGEVALLPARASVAQSTDFWEKITPEQAETLQYALLYSYLAQPDGGEIYQVFNDAVNAVLAGEKTVESALTVAQAASSSSPTEEEDTPAFTVSEENDALQSDIATITFLINSNLDLEAYRILAEEFETIYSDIRLEVRRHTISTFSSLPNAADNADCFQSWFASVDEESRSVILSLDPFIEADTSFDLGDFYPVLVAQYTDQGQLWGLPASVQPFVIEYNKDLFDAANIIYPSFDWTLNEFLETAVALTQGEEETKQYGFAGDAIEFNLLPLMLERLGAGLINDGLAPSTLMLDTPTTIEAMRWYSSLTTEFGVKPIFVADPQDIQNAERVLAREQLLNEQRVAMWTPSFYSEVGVLDPAIRETLNIGVAPFPVGDGGGVLPASGYYISASTPYRDICWEWIKFLSLSPAVGQGVPARHSVAESEVYSQRVGKERATAYLASITAAVGESIIFRLQAGDESWMLEAIYWLGRAYAQITNGEATVEEALATAQATFDVYRDCMIAHDGFANVELRNRCIQDADPTLPTFLLERR